VSHDATAWARKQRTGNTPAKFLLMMLADYAGSDYSCWPSQDTLSTLTEMSERTIRRATELLVQQGLLRVFYRYRADNSRRSCRYQLLIDGPETELPETVDWRSMKQLEPDSVTDGPPDTLTATPGQAVQPYRSESPVIPPVDPSVEPSLPIPGASRTKFATRLPDDFQPTEDMKRWFAGENLQTVIPDPRAEHENFCDYWRAKAGADARKLDWPATWRRWMRTAASRAPRGGGYRPTSGAPYRSSTDMKIQQTATLAERFRPLEENQ
jgi:hypothetical protein